MKTLKEHLEQQLNESKVNKKLIMDILDGADRDYITLDDLLANLDDSQSDSLIGETADIAVDYLNTSMTAPEIADAMFNKGKLCKELAKLGWSNEPCDRDGVWEWHPDKTTKHWAFELSLFGVRTDMCLNVVSQYDEEEHRTDIFIELCQCETKKCKPNTNTAVFCMDVYGNDMV